MKELQRYWAKTHPYEDINDAPWFRDLAEKAVTHSERNGNRIYIYFGNAKDALECNRKCESRNISYTDGYMHCLSDNTYRVDILMNWKERRPSKHKRNQEQILN